MPSQIVSYALEKKLLAKLDLAVKRTTGRSKKDVLFIVEGDEGEGKTTLSCLMAHAYSLKTGRPFGIKNLFFRAEALVDFLKNSKEQIAVYDEPALDALSSEWFKKSQRELTKLLMLVRKRKHFLIFNCSKFYKYNDYLMVDRPRALIHVYSRGGVKPGRLCYIPKKKLMDLYNDYMYRGKKRNYSKYSSLFYGGFKGSFPDALDKVFSKEELEEYEKNKDKAIESIGEEDKKVNKEKIELRQLKARLAHFILPITTTEGLASQLGVNDRTLRTWKNYSKRVSLSEEEINDDFEEGSDTKEIKMDTKTPKKEGYS